MTLNLEEFRRAVYEGSISVIENINAVAERQERERQRKWMACSQRDVEVR